MDPNDFPSVAREALRPDFSMGWNLFLAALPFLLAWALFRYRGRRGLVWWFGLALFVLLLPNAPYTLTDLLHLVRKARQDPPLPEWAVVVFSMPEYVLYVGAGLSSYVFSLLLLGDDLRRRGKGRLVVPLEAALHVLCAVGIYLGRVVRFNSWDMATDPQAVMGAAAGAMGRARPVLFMLGTTLALAVVYYPLKFIAAAVLTRWRGQAPLRECRGEGGEPRASLRG
jgi:uncharacterized membrane protein